MNVAIKVYGSCEIATNISFPQHNEIGNSEKVKYKLLCEISSSYLNEKFIYMILFNKEYLDWRKKIGVIKGSKSSQKMLSYKNSGKLWKSEQIWAKFIINTGNFLKNKQTWHSGPEKKISRIF